MDIAKDVEGDVPGAIAPVPDTTHYGLCTHRGLKFRFQTRTRCHSRDESVTTDVTMTDNATGTSVKVQHVGSKDEAVKLAKDKLWDELKRLGHVSQQPAQTNPEIPHEIRFGKFSVKASVSEKRRFITSENLKYSDMITHDPIGCGRFGTVFRVTFKQGSYKGHVLAAAKNLRIMNPKEIHILKTAQHPNIVTFLDYVQEGLSSVIVTELADESLRARLNRNRGDISEALQTKWTRECASAIKYLHEGLPDVNGTLKPVVHRDIKADNCLLFAGDLVKLCDFGIAEETIDTTGTSSRKGTEAWMAPELVVSSKFSTATDIYAFGVLLWEITTQDMPTAHQDTRGARQWGQSMSDLRYSFPRFAKDLLPLCWKIDRHDRPTIDDVIARLPRGSTIYSMPSDNNTGSSASTELEIDLK